MQGTQDGGLVARQSTRAQLMPTLDARIARQARERVRQHAAWPEAIDARLAELDREWGVERLLQLNSAVLSLVGLGLASRGNRRWLALPAVVQLFLAQHGVQGWCPPLVLLRKLGVRTMSEVEAERFALKALRGELAGLEGRADVERLLEATTQEADAHAQPGPASTLERTPAHSPAPANARIRRTLRERLAAAVRRPELREERLAALEREWDVERVVQVEGPLTTLTGILLAWRGDRRWLALPVFAQGMMVLHALWGPYPLLPLLRAVGVRTEPEISTERYALKALRGDFAGVAQRPSAEARADAAFDAAQPA